MPGALLCHCAKECVDGQAAGAALDREDLGVGQEAAQDNRGGGEPACAEASGRQA